MDFKYANKEDLKSILTFIKDLAAYEQMEDQAVADEKTLEYWLFDEKKAEVIFVLEGE